MEDTDLSLPSKLLRLVLLRDEYPPSILSQVSSAWKSFKENPQLASRKGSYSIAALSTMFRWVATGGELEDYIVLFDLCFGREEGQEPLPTDIEVACFEVFFLSFSIPLYLLPSFSSPHFLVEIDELLRTHYLPFLSIGVVLYKQYRVIEYNHRRFVSRFVCNPLFMV